jgi:transcriptional regulator with XRE-family HTH domain
LADQPTDDPAEIAASQLKAARERAGLTQTEAARLLGIDNGTLSRYERGKMQIPAAVLLRANKLSAKAPRHEQAPTAEPPPSLPPTRPTTTAEWRDTALYMTGVLDTQIRTMRGVTSIMGGLGESLEAVRDMLEQAVNGVAEVAASGILPRPGGPLPPGWSITPLREPQSLDDLHAIEARIAAMRQEMETAARGEGGRNRATGP